MDNLFGHILLLIRMGIRRRKTPTLKTISHKVAWKTVATPSLPVNYTYCIPITPEMEAITLFGNVGSVEIDINMN